MLIAAITLLLASAALLTRGLIGRRIGEEPRCRKCNYNLTGVESKECPECGRPWTIESTPKGLRHCRKRPIALGLILLLAGAPLAVSTATGYIQRTNWFSHLPTTWVLGAAANGNLDAFEDLVRRYDNKRLAAKQIDIIIENGLRVQASSQTSAATQRWIDLLWRIETRDGLSKEQRDRYFRQMIQIELALRPRVRREGRLPLECQLRPRAPASETFTGTIGLNATLKDGTVLPATNPMEWFYLTSDRISLPNLPRTDSLSHAFETSAFHPGTYDLICHLSTSLRNTSSRGVVRTWSGQHMLIGSFEIIDPSAGAPVQIVDDAGALAAIRDAIEFRVKLSAVAVLNLEWRLKRPISCDAVFLVGWEPYPSRPFVDPFFERSKPYQFIHQNRSQDQFVLAALELGTSFKAGDVLTIFPRSTDDCDWFGTSAARLKGDLSLGPVQLIVQE